jgi:hypothetical protein
MLAWLLQCRCPTRYCLRPREDGMILVFSVPAMLPAPCAMGSAPSKISQFSGLRVRFRARTLYLVGLAYLPILWVYACGWLTKPCPRGLQLPHSIEPEPGLNRAFCVRLLSLFCSYFRYLGKYYILHAVEKCQHKMRFFY